jgi:hypothetical protein
VTVLGQLRAVAPPGQVPGGAAVQQLRKLTRELIAERGDAATAEHERFLDMKKREICLPHDQLAAALGESVVLVTGGTGCVGSTLLGELVFYHPARVVSVSRGNSYPWQRHSAEYRQCDIRDDAFRRLVREVSPDVIFHVAGQRDPGLAETEVHRTVTTNVLGTRNVLRAAEGAHVVFASTGKALRPFSPDIYTASKRAAEALMVAGSAVRFTHIADNSIFYRRLQGWAQEGMIARLHSADGAFYVQSALEAAQLLLLGALDTGRIRVIRDLGFPVGLLDLSLGVLASSGSPALQISGYDQGYEEIPFPGLYDPRTAGDVSPLLNAFEATETEAESMTDSCPNRGGVPELGQLREICGRTQDPAAIRAELRAVSWTLLDDTLASVPEPVLARVIRLAEQAASPDHDRVLLHMKQALAGL